MANQFENKRIKKANLIIDTCKSIYEAGADEGIELNKMISLICLRYGSGQRYVKEIVNDLVTVGQINLVGDKLYFNPTFQ